MYFVTMPSRILKPRELGHQVRCHNGSSPADTAI